MHSTEACITEAQTEVFLYNLAKLKINIKIHVLVTEILL